jgi:DNA-binding FrmR family transcriptional regulator
MEKTTEDTKPLEEISNNISISAQILKQLYEELLKHSTVSLVQNEVLNGNFKDMVKEVNYYSKLTFRLMLFLGLLIVATNVVIPLIK